MTVLVAALSAFVGLISGYFLRDLIESVRRRRSREGTMNRPKITAQMVQFAILAVAVALLLAEGLLLVKLQRDNAQYVQCMAQWQQDKSAADNARAAAATEVSTAMDNVVTAVYEQDQHKFKRAISDYIAIREDQDVARAKNPPPAPPDEVCGKPGDN